MRGINLLLAPEMKNAFATFLHAVSILLLGLVITITGTSPFSAQADSLPSASFTLNQSVKSGSGIQVITTNPDDGFDAHFDLLIGETEVEENELETEHRFLLESTYFISHAFCLLSGHLETLQSKLADQNIGRISSGSPLFITLSVLRL